MEIIKKNNAAVGWTGDALAPLAAQAVAGR